MGALRVSSRRAPGQLRFDLRVVQRTQVLQAARAALLHQRVQDGAYPGSLDISQAADTYRGLHRA